MSKYAFCFMALLLLYSELSLAGLENLDVVPMGESEALMSNTGIANSQSSGQVYFNPAGLARIEGKRFSATGSTYYMFNNTFLFNGEKNDFSSIGTIPNLVASSRRLGSWVVALTVLTPIITDTQIRLSTGDATSNFKSRFQSQTKEQETMIGIAAGRKLSESWDFGFSIFAHWYERKKVESVQLEPSLVLAEATLVKDELIKVSSLLAVLGLQYQLDERWSFGARLKSPNLKMSGKAETHSDLLYVDLGPPVQTPLRQVGDQRYGASYKLPLDLGVGLKFKPSSKQTFLFDMNYAFATGFQISDEPNSESFDTKATLRANFGYSLRARQDLEFLGGLLWNPSSLDKLNTANGQTPNHFFGGTFGAKFHEDNVESGIGFFYINSRADKKIIGPKDNPAGLNIYGALVSATIRY